MISSINPDFAFGCTHKCFMHLKVALNIALLMDMELFLNRSVKSLNLAALKDRDNQPYTKAARLRLLTDQFFTLLKRKIFDKLLDLIFCFHNTLETDD
jgi:hypothetical protein